MHAAWMPITSGIKHGRAVQNVRSVVYFYRGGTYSEVNYARLPWNLAIMNSILKNIPKRLVPLILAVSCAATAAAGEIDEAVQKYYAGFPEEAISMMKPLALAGDVQAQYLLGNILYSLAGTKKFDDIDDPVKWYQMAAEQNSAAANYALGVIFQNKWSKARNRRDAASAIVYYQRAVDLGYQKARPHLKRIKSLSGISDQEAKTLAQQQVARIAPEAESRDDAVKNEKSDSKSTSTLLSLDDAPTDIEMAKQDEPVTGLNKVPENSNQVATLTNGPDDESAMTVTLSDIASQCQNYTAAGFNLYAETIKGARLSGSASTVGIGPDQSKPGAYRVNLTRRQSGSAVSIDLHEVPKAVADRLEQGKKFGITGIVVDSEAIGPGCSVSVIYLPVEG